MHTLSYNIDLNRAPAARRRRRRQQRDTDNDKNYLGDVALESDVLKKVSRPSTKNRTSFESRTSSRQQLIDYVDDRKKKRESGATSVISLNLCESPPPPPSLLSTATPSPINNKPKKKIHRGNSIEPMDDETKIEKSKNKSRSSIVKIDRVPRQSLPSEPASLDRSKNGSPKPSSNLNESAAKPTHIYVKKIARTETSLSRRSRRSSVGNHSVISLDRSAADLQLMANRTRPRANTNVSGSGSGHEIVVTKVHRSKSITSSHQ